MSEHHHHSYPESIDGNTSDKPLGFFDVFTIFAPAVFYALVCLCLCSGCVERRDYGPREDRRQVTPIKSEKPSVMIVEESADRSKLPGPQVAIFTSVRLREWAAENCAKRADGTPDFAVIDKDQWKDDLVKQAVKDRPSLIPWVESNIRTMQISKQFPCVWITRGKKMEFHPLPANVDAMIDLLEGRKQ